MFLLIGGDSEIGSATFRELIRVGKPVLATTRRRGEVSPQRPFLDLTEPLAQWEPPPDTQAACIFASMARLAACASDPGRSRFINVEQNLAIAERLTARGIYVLLLSTNQVFDGSQPNIRAEAPFRPITEYGRQKADLEKQLHTKMADGAPISILRLAKVVSPTMPLLHQWISLLAGGKSIEAFSDMTFAPTPLAKVTAAIVALLVNQAKGIYQLSGPRDVTYADAGKWLAARIEADVRLVKPIRAALAGFAEGTVPPNTTLDSSLLRERYALVVPDAWQVMETVMAAATKR